jgi:hypothetical protein
MDGWNPATTRIKEERPEDGVMTLFHFQLSESERSREGIFVVVYIDTQLLV